MKHSAPSEQGIIGRKTVLAFCLAQFFYMSVMNMVTSQLNYYATDLLLIPVGVVGAITVTGKVLEVVTAPFSGIMIEHVRMPWGKYRSWLYVASVPFVIFHMLIFFSAKLPLGAAGKAALFALFLILASLAGNVVQSVQTSLVQGITYEDRDRKRLVKSNTSGNYLAKTATGLIWLPLIALVMDRGGSEADGFALVMALIALLAVGGYFALGHVVKRTRVDERDDCDYGVREMLRITFSNRPLLCAFGTFFMRGGAYFIVIGTASYYFKYVAGMPKMTATFMTLINLAALSAVLLSPLFFRLLQNRWGYLISLTLMAGACLAAYLARAQYWGFIAAMCVFAFGDAMAGMYSHLLFAEAVDYCEYRNRVSFRGLAMCLHTLALDGGRIFQQMIIAVGFSIMGYSAAEGVSAAQTPVLMGIICLTPLFFLILAAVILRLYPLDRAAMETIRAELLRRREGGG